MASLNNKNYLLIAHSLLALTGCTVISAVANEDSITEVDRGITIIDADGNVISPLTDNSEPQPIQYSYPFNNYYEGMIDYECFATLKDPALYNPRQIEYNQHRNKFNKQNTNRNQLVHRTRNNCGHRNRV